jgi:hypothetical protein
MDIGRRLRPELPDEVLRQILDGAARPSDPQTVRDYCRAHYPFEPPLPMTLYFRPGVERLFSGKSTSQVTMHHPSPPAAGVYKTGAPGPDQLEPVAAPTAPDKTKVWLPAEVGRRRKLNDIPKDITTFARQLHNAAHAAVREGRLAYPPSARRFETLLHELDLFPKVKRRTKDARKTHD